MKGRYRGKIFHAVSKVETLKVCVSRILWGLSGLSAPGVIRNKQR